MPDDILEGEDLYDDEEDALGAYLAPTDPIDEAVAAEGYVTGYVVDKCFRSFPDGSWTPPERFDRFYWVPAVDRYDGLAPLLVDVLRTDTDEEQKLEREEKSVDFKREWCEVNHHRYVVLVESKMATPGDVRRAVADQLPAGTAEDRPTAASAPKAQRGGAKKGIQKPRAA